VCTAYECNGSRFNTLPSDLSVLRRCRPVYKEMPGWQEDLSTARRMQDLPAAARTYLQFIKELVGAPIDLISVGNERSQIIVP